MVPLELRQCVPLFASAQSLEIVPLSGVISLNNSNYKVLADGVAYLLRVGADSAAALGIRRDEEQAAARAAAQVGVGPELLFSEPSGLMVMPFVVGKHWSAEDTVKPENLTRIVQALHRLHSLTDVAAPCSIYERIERLMASVATLGLEPPTELDRLWGQLYAFRDQRATDTRFAPCLCHHDLWLNNFLDDGQALWLVDWEFAGVGDRLYDLATIAMGTGYSRETQQALLTAYGYSDESDLATLEQMKNVVRFFEAAWALVQHGLRGSGGDFDYLAYSQRTFAAFRDASLE